MPAMWLTASTARPVRRHALARRRCACGTCARTIASMAARTIPQVRSGVKTRYWSPGRREARRRAHAPSAPARAPRCARRPRRPRARWCRRRRRPRRAACSRRRAGRARPAPPPASAPPRSAVRRRARTAASACSQILRSASGQTTAPMSRPSATASPAARKARCASRIAERTAGCAETVETLASTSAERRRGSSAIAVASGAQLGQRGGVVERRAVVQRHERDRAVHRRRCRGSGSRAAARARARRSISRPPRGRRWRSPWRRKA